MTARIINLWLDIVTGAVIMSVAVALAGLTWRLIGESGTSVAPNVAASGTRTRAPFNADPILAFAPFGRTGAHAIPATTLALQLRGVMLAEPRSESVAVIAGGSEPPKAFATGDTVPGGATVEDIAVDRVLLRVGGRQEMLAFPGSNQPVHAPAGAPEPVRSAATATIEELDAKPESGGYRIGPNPPAMARNAGLLPGDVIERFDGATVGDPARDRQMLAAAALAGGTRIGVVRGGRRITLYMPIR